MAIFVFFYVFLWVRNCSGFFSCVFSFLSIFVFCSILELETVISYDMCNIVDVKSNLSIFSICEISKLSGRSRCQSVCQFSFTLTHFCNGHAAITMRFASARAHSFNTSPLPFVTILRHHPSSSPFALRHHFPQSPPFVAFFCVMYCYFVITLRHHFPQAPPFIAFF